MYSRIFETNQQVCNRHEHDQTLQTSYQEQSQVPYHLRPSNSHERTTSFLLQKWYLQPLKRVFAHQRNLIRP
jgi:hypothetical protein